jgi:hypothetical protein
LDLKSLESKKMDRICQIKMLIDIIRDKNQIETFKLCAIPSVDPKMTKTRPCPQQEYVLMSKDSKDIRHILPEIFEKMFPQDLMCMMPVHSAN